MRLIGIWIADALHDAQRLILQQLGQTVQRRMQADLIVDLPELIGGQLERRPELGILRIGKWHDGVQAVVSAGELDHDQDRVLGTLLVGERRCQGRPGQKRRNGQTP